MIDISSVLRDLPSFDTFCSVATLQELVERVRRDSMFVVHESGRSAGGVPIHHVRFGSGSKRVLFVGFPHPNEPVGGLTVFSLLTLLQARHPALVDADVEWHVIPCIDPDGAMLNEGWSQAPFTLGAYLRSFHRQDIADQVESSFPIHYKKLIFDKPTAEATILRQLLDQVQPDFYFPLHNMATGGGAWYCITRDIGEPYYQQLYRLLEQHRVPLRQTLPFEGFAARFAPGVIENFSTRKWYDFLEDTTPEPQQLLAFGNMASDYLEEIKSDSFTFVAEMPFVKHPSDESTRATGQSLRRIKLRVYAEIKYLVAAICEEWDAVKDDLDASSPFYKKIFGSIISVRDRIADGLPGWPDKTRDLLFSPVNGREMSESDRFNVYLKEFFILCQYYEFVRLLQLSKQTEAVKRAADRLDAVFDDLLQEIDANIDFQKFEVIDYDTLVKTQFGSGLIVLNSLLEAG